ncbi:uncharacterized protein [Amphiura filiformis]|uniref:uncharacterized protein n=1 Tax=Amphiura filiformis TaxID=82378 RepID=UPI003B20FF37
MGHICLLLVTRIFNISAMKALSYQKDIFATYFVLFLLFQSCNAVVDLTMGVLGPWNTSSPDAFPFWATRTLGAVSLAVDEINNAGILGDDKLLTFAYKDSDCDSKQASGSTVELYSTKQVSSYVAPPCSTPCRSVSDLTDFWQNPTIAWFCAETERTNDKYLVRTYAPFSSISNIATITMEYYKWTSASIIFPSSNTWESLAFHIREHLDDNNIDVAWFYDYHQPLSLDKAKEILQKVRTVSHGKMAHLFYKLFRSGVRTLSKEVIRLISLRESGQGTPHKHSIK